MIEKIRVENRDDVIAFFKEHWGSPEMIISTGSYQVDKLEGFIYYDEGKIVGLMTYVIKGNIIEVISLDSIEEGKGIGTSLMREIERYAENLGIHSIELITTNDNLHAIGFYQKRGYRIMKIIPDAVNEARKIKPSIPLYADNGILIRDELLFRKEIVREKENMNVNSIREAEKKYHDDFYNSSELYAPGSWVSKPVPNVLEAFHLLNKTQPIRILDIGAGSGRNAIKLAKLSSEGSVVECFDILESAVSALDANAQKFLCSDKIISTVSSIEDYKFYDGGYDLIVGVSTLEHVSCEKEFDNVLLNIKKHLKVNGIACLIINTEVTEHDAETNQQLIPQFEVNISTEKLQHKIEMYFKDCEELKTEVKALKYKIERNNREVVLSTNAVTYILRK